MQGCEGGEGAGAREARGGVVRKGEEFGEREGCADVRGGGDVGNDVELAGGRGGDGGGEGVKGGEDVGCAVGG